MSEKALDKPLEMKIPSQQAQEYHLEREISLINETANIDEASDMIRIEVAEDKSEHDGIDFSKCSDKKENAIVNIKSCKDVIDEREWEPHMVDIGHPLHEACEEENEGTINTPQKMEMPSELTQDYNQKHLWLQENFEVQGLESPSGNEENATNDVLNRNYIKLAGATEGFCQVCLPLSRVSLASDELSKCNTKLIEENERLRDMMEKLIKSGQEQLSAISTLSGRVKALDKRLSSKKKLKTKRCRTLTSVSIASDHDTV